MTILPKVARKLQDLEPGALIELFEVHVGSMPGHAGEEPLRLHAGTNELSENVIYAGHAYARWPVEAEGFESSSQGASPRPTLRLANASDTEYGVFSSLLQQYGGLVKCPVTRILILAEFLDADNFEGGNPLADPAATTSVEVWRVERKKLETPTVIELELASPLDRDGVLLPLRQVVGASCNWPEYKGTGCGYNGTLYFNARDEAVTDPALDVCSRTLKGCVLRHAYVVTWSEQKPVRYTACAAAMQADTVLNNPALEAEEGKLWPKSWSVWKRPSRLRRKATIVDVYWDGFRTEADEVKLVRLDQLGTPIASLPAGAHLTLWIQMTAGRLPAGAKLRLSGEARASHSAAYATLGERTAAELSEFGMWQVNFTVPAVVPEVDGDGITNDFATDKFAPTISLVGLGGAEENAVEVPGFALRLGQLAVGTRTDYSEFTAVQMEEKIAPKVADLPFGGFVGASLVRT